MWMRGGPIAVPDWTICIAMSLHTHDFKMSHLQNGCLGVRGYAPLECSSHWTNLFCFFLLRSHRLEKLTSSPSIFFMHHNLCRDDCRHSSCYLLRSGHPQNPAWYCKLLSGPILENPATLLSATASYVCSHIFTGEYNQRPPFILHTEVGNNTVTMSARNSLDVLTGERKQG